MELELRNVELRAGDKLKVEGTVLEDADRFQIDLGCNSEDLSLHFNPRFHDDTDGRVIVCNSKCDGCWGSEQREAHNPFHRGEHVKVTVKVMEAGFEVELPGGQEIHFPDRRGLDTLTYVRVREPCGQKGNLEVEDCEPVTIPSSLSELHLNLHGAPQNASAQRQHSAAVL
ncbi:hypothetical protein SKAU_G00427470 [Synaphobranchus kaupii]|uniref:Galectin n=1 Tax=Synaphobranchus kaupii TaxID=118154 RepID=A0A9Q1IAA4_SYNKA|nr:hypothetical protein SKAU_G00427470 [Synaphobranchus kaupii]